MAGQAPDLRPVVVTGVSTGIGRAVALALADAGHLVYGGVRKPEDGVAFEAALDGRGRALIFDVADEAAVRRAAAGVAAEAPEGLAGLVNNAGIAVGGPLQHLPLADFRRQLEVNVTGVLAVTQAFLPLLGATDPPHNGPGRIVMMSSVSGRTAYPFVGPYAASKFALEALSDALRRELVPYGIRVAVLEPGPIRTPIWAKGDAEDYAPYAATAYAPALERIKPMMLGLGEGGLPPEAVGRAVLRLLRARRPRLRTLVVRGGPLAEILFGLIPGRLLDRLIARQLGLRWPGRR